MANLIRQNGSHHFFQLRKLLKNTRFLKFLQFLIAKFCKCSRQCICILRLEKHQIFRWNYTFIFGNGIIYTILTGYLLKTFQIGLSDIDIRDSLILSNQLFDTLFTVCRQVFRYCFLCLCLCGVNMAVSQLYCRSYCLRCLVIIDKPGTQCKLRYNYSVC